MSSSTRQLPTAGRRANEDWLAALRSDDGVAMTAQADLRQYVRRGLERALGPRDGLDDATFDDLTQEALLRITSKLDRFRGDSQFTTWAMAVAIRVAFTTLRRKRWGDRSLQDLGISPHAEPVTTASSAPDPRSRISKDDLLRTLHEAIERDLTPRQRAAVLSELAGMPTSVLADQLGTNLNALYKLHHDARLRLRAALKKRGFAEAEVRSVLAAASNP